MQRFFTTHAADAIVGNLVIGLGCAALWWGLTEGDHQSWVVGGPAVIAATAAAQWLRWGSGCRVRPWAVLRFAAYFLRASIAGGVDVASRAVTMRIDPGVINYSTQLKGEMAQAMFAGVIGLLPGTLTVRLESGQLRVHALLAKPSTEQSLQRLENLIGALFGEAISHSRR